MARTPASTFPNTALTGAMLACEGFGRIGRERHPMEIMIAGLVLVLGALTYLIYRLAATLQERK